jgi:hypothetical protein
MTTTTDLDIIRKYPNRFTWGKVTKITDVGPYTIVEFTALKKSVLMKGRAPIEFHIYVDEKDTSTGAMNFDEALLLAISIRHLGKGTYASHMAVAAVKILGIKLLA